MSIGAAMATRHDHWLWRLAAAAMLATSFLIVPATANAAGTFDWNDGQIQWKPFAQGISQAKSESKPVLLVMYASWCSHCHNFARVFHDEQVVKLAKEFVMVRFDVDSDASLAQRYSVDGEYVPRTFFLSPAGDIYMGVHEQRPNYRYFYDERNPASILRAMHEVLAMPQVCGE